MDDDVVLCCGKIPNGVLAPLLAALPSAAALIPPSIGVDACALRFDNQYVCVKADPITMAREKSGRAKDILSLNI